MDFIECINNIYKMCKSFEHCCDCPLLNSNFPCEGIAPVFTELNLTQVVDIVNKWCMSQHNKK